MRSSMLSKGAALGTAALLIGLSAGPAMAADTVARASASALQADVAGSGTGTGSYTSTYTDHESTSGTNSPQITALGGQDFLSEGVLTQDATSSAPGGTGKSAACAGLGGQGSTVIAAGNGNCLGGGQTLALDAAHLDLSQLGVNAQSILDIPAGQQVEDAINNIVNQLPVGARDLTGPLQNALQTALKQLGNPGLHVNVGAINSQCTADGSDLAGDSTLADVGAWLDVPTVGRVDLVKLPVHPAPNTKVVTGLSSVTDALLKGLRTNFKNALAQEGQNGGPLAPLNNVLNQLQPVVKQITDQLGTALKPVEQNLLDATLNKQTRSNGKITVTALDLHLLPAARQFINADLAHVQIAKSSCGPNGRVVQSVATPPTKKTPHKAAPPAKKKAGPVPTSVPAGLASGDENNTGADLLVGLLVLSAGTAGVISYRRRLLH